MQKYCVTPWHWTREFPRITWSSIAHAPTFPGLHCTTAIVYALHQVTMAIATTSGPATSKEKNWVDWPEARALVCPVPYFWHKNVHMYIYENEPRPCRPPTEKVGHSNCQCAISLYRLPPQKRLPLYRDWGFELPTYSLLACTLVLRTS